MKKIILGVFTLVFVICATACSSSNSSSKTTSSSSNLVEETTETVKLYFDPVADERGWRFGGSFRKVII